MEPNSSRNSTGNKIVKNSAARSRTKPWNMARDRLRKPCQFGGP
jgi:hypothetical protein